MAGTEALPLPDIPLVSVGQETVEMAPGGGGGGGPGAAGETETTGHCRLVVECPHFPRPRTRASATHRHHLLRNQPVDLQLLQIWSKPETFSPVQTQTPVGRGQDWRNLSIDSRCRSLSLFSQCLAGAMERTAKSVVMVCPSIYY